MNELDNIFNGLDMYDDGEIVEISATQMRQAFAQLAALKAERDDLLKFLKQAHECVSDMAYHTHDADISKDVAIMRIQNRWMDYPITEIAAALKGEK